MIDYFFQTSCCWIVFYLFYFLALRRETFFSSNRFYLLGSLSFGLIFPLIDFHWFSFLAKDTTASIMVQPLTVKVNQLGYTLEEIVVTANQTSATSIGSILAGIYLVVVGLLGIRLFYGIHSLRRFKKRSTVEKKQGYELIKTETLHLPFSFFNSLYWSEKLDLSKADRDQILRHELTHIQQHHSIDIIILEVISILFWFNPIVWFYRKAIRNTHEYLADQNVLVESKKKQYGQLLLRQMQSGIAFSLANNFNHSQLKKRFNMMNQNKSSRWAMTKYLWAAPVFALLILAFKASEVLPKTSAQNPILPTQQFHVNQPPSDSIYTKVEQMPLFPGCEEVADLTKRNACSTKKMLENIYSKIKYPKLARKNNTQGLVVVQFVVNRKGEIESPKIIRSLGDGLDKEVIRVVMEMPQWTPGKQNGKKVSVFYNLPVKFELTGIEPVEKEDISPKIHVVGHSFPKTDDEDILSKVDQMPFYPGCSDISDLEERRDCANNKMLRSIYTQIRYPELARKTGTQGAVVIQFVVDKNGKIKNPKVLRSIGHGCDLEVLRVVQAMPDWDPGIHKGKPVNVYFNLPVKFKLEGDPPKVDESVEPINLNIFPNPASSEITVKINAAEKPTKLYISDITGKVLKEVDYKNFSGSGTDSFDLTSFATKGTLLITITQGDISKTEQVILQ